MATEYQREVRRKTTPQCLTDGVGCDGYHDNGNECVCTCHGLYAPMFRTNDDVLAWHIPPGTHRLAQDDAEANDYRADPIRDHRGRVWVLLPQFRSRG